MTYRYIDKKGETIYKWTPSDDEEDDIAPRFRNDDEFIQRSILSTEVGALVKSNMKMKELVK